MIAMGCEPHCRLWDLWEWEPHRRLWDWWECEPHGRLWEQWEQWEENCEF